MSSISKTEALLASMRKQALAAARGGPAVSPKSTAAKPKGAQTRSPLAAEVAMRIAQIAQDDPQRRRRAFRFFLEASLSNLVGPESALDPTFQAAVQRVEEVMLAEPGMSDAIDKLSDRLLEGAHTGGTLLDIAAVLGADNQ